MLREATCWTRKTSNYLKKSDPSSSVSCAAQITQVKMGLFLNCLKIASISSLAHRDFVAFFFFFPAERCLQQGRGSDIVHRLGEHFLRHWGDCTCFSPLRGLSNTPPMLM